VRRIAPEAGWARTRNRFYRLGAAFGHIDGLR
jgi:hypothetical protein